MACDTSRSDPARGSRGRGSLRVPEFQSSRVQRSRVSRGDRGGRGAGRVDHRGDRAGRPSGRVGPASPHASRALGHRRGSPFGRGESHGCLDGSHGGPDGARVGLREHPHSARQRLVRRAPPGASPERSRASSSLPPLRLRRWLTASCTRVHIRARVVDSHAG
jgi:hypothetical protein